MNLSTSIVDLDSIQVNSAPFASSDKQAEIEALAHTIVELKGVLRIPVVRSRGIDEYELVSGHLEYYAFLKARDIDPKLPDRMTVFILKPNNEKAILKQLEADQAVQQLTVSDGSEQPQLEGALALKVGNLESRVDQQSRQLSDAIERLKSDMLAAINAKLPQPLPLLEALNRITEPAVQEQVLRKLAFLGKKKALKVVDSLRAYKKKHKDQEFKQFNEVLQALEKGTLSAAKMLEVIDQWES